MTSTVDSRPVASVAGFTFRGILDLGAELAEMVRVGMHSRLVDGVEETIDEPGMRVFYGNLTNCDLEQDVQLVELDGRLIAYGRASWADDDDGVRRYDAFSFIDPDHRRAEVRRAILHVQVERLRRIAQEHDPGDRRCVLSSFSWDVDTDNAALLLSEGYVPVRHFVEMVRPGLESIERPPLPPGLEVRPVLPEHVRPIFDAHVEAFRDEWGDFDGSDEAFRRLTEDATFEPHLWRVAWAGDQVAGAIVNRIDPTQNATFGYRRGWLDAVAVRRPWRRRGLGSALIGLSLEALRDAGMASAALGVDTQNPSGALRLYERAGFVVRHSSTAYEKPLDEA